MNQVDYDNFDFNNAAEEESWAYDQQLLEARLAELYALLSTTQDQIAATHLTLSDLHAMLSKGQ